MYAGPGMSFMDPNLLEGIRTRQPRPGKRGAKNKSLPYHGRRRHMNIGIMGTRELGYKGCMHALAQHQDLTAANGRPITVSFALPCQVAHKKTTKNPTHKDTAGRKWQ